MFSIRDILLKQAGFEWPHLFATCFNIDKGREAGLQEGIDNDQLLNQLLPAMLATSKASLIGTILPNLFSDDQAAGQAPGRKSTRSGPQQNPLSACGTKRLSVTDIYIVDVDNGTVMQSDEYRDQLRREGTHAQ